MGNQSRTFDRWFKDIDLVELDATSMTLRVPNNIYQLWIETNYISLLRGAVLMVLKETREIRFVFAGESDMQRLVTFITHGQGHDPERP